ncbi:hypothetical protein [Chryseobacterium taichungense]|uniref:hypothetical protein n=1 Tax=Chryseobacterium taichungense TaxID=295069 RepID=UPI0028AC6FA3|nr:hypothetical protein [Chryseobacterium taichungense]
MKKNNFLILVIIAMLFIWGCRSESLNSIDEVPILSVSGKTDTTGTYKMKDVPDFKNYLQKKLISSISKSNEGSDLFPDDKLVDVINIHGKVSYSTVVNKGNSVFDILVYTVSEKEKSFFIAEFVSDKEMAYLDFHLFNGTVNYKAGSGEIFSSIRFENGKPLSQTTNKVVGCITTITTPVSCIEGLHMPGQPCAYAGTLNAAYYDTQIINNCHTNQIYNDIGGGGGYGSGGGGSNPAYNLPAPNALNYMLLQIGMPTLNSQQFSYVQNNIATAEKLRTYFLDNQNINGANFLYWGIDFLRQNPSVSWEEFWYNKYADAPGSSIDNEGNQSGNYDENNYENFDFENQQTQWPNINSVIPISDFVGWGTNGIRRNCMDYAKAQIAKKGYNVSNYYDVDSQGNKQTFQIYTEQGGVNLSDLYKGVSYLKYALSNGIPVIVGIDDKTGHPGNLDNSTDHFVVIVGMGTDSKGRYFRFYDNASGDASQGTHSENKLYIKYPQRIFTGQTQCIEYRAGTEYDYIITMIRKSK